MDYGALLRETRERRGLTLAELASMLRVKQSSLADWEAGRTQPNLLQVPPLCFALQLSYDDFFGSARRSRRGHRREQAYFQYSYLPAMYRYVIRFRREKKKLSLPDFARKAGVSPAAAERWEQGRAIPKLDEIPRICDALGMKLWEFFE